VIEQETDAWYSLLLARGSEEELSALTRDLCSRRQQASPSPRRGLSVQAMWAITLTVAIGLFLQCVLLIFTSEVRIYPIR
jgi:hypothetical protein